MIELCTKKRMIISICALGVLTVLILIWEEKLTSSQGFSQTPSPTPYIHNKSGGESVNALESGNNNVDNQKSRSIAPSGDNNFNACWLTEGFTVIQECSPCTQFEINSKSPLVCEITGLKEVIECTKSGKKFRSCLTVKSTERKFFWIFEVLMLFLSVVSYGYCKFRSSQLERLTIKQIENRLAAGH